MGITECLLWLLLGALLFVACRCAVELWWRPFFITTHFRAQGIRGPPYRFFYGNLPEMKAMMLQEGGRPKQTVPVSHDALPHVFPFYRPWSESYGKPFLLWFGWKPQLMVEDTQLVKEIMYTKFWDYPKLPLPRGGGEVIGSGAIGTLKGQRWAERRRVLNPVFYTESLKGMSSIMVACAVEMVEKWQKMLSAGQNEIEVFKQFRVLTADVIARTAFGTNYVEGKRIFEIQIEQAQLIAESQRSVRIPGFRYLPTYENRHRRKLRKEVCQSMVRLIKSRLQQASTERADSYGNDLLGILLSPNRDLEGKRHTGEKMNGLLSINEIVDECRTFFFTGHETTSNLLSWTMMLLGQHLDWQERARVEVMEVCGGKNNLPSMEIVSHLRIVGMILFEALRLYPPGVALLRQASRTMNLGKLSIPEGTQLCIPIVAMHYDSAIWGEDAHQFNPQRFVNGVAKACKDPMAFLPFGGGPRNCIGQNFALLEAKLALCTILQHFTFHLSPTYVHAPFTVITLQPKHGVQIMLEEI